MVHSDIVPLLTNKERKANQKRYRESPEGIAWWKAYRER